MTELAGNSPSAGDNQHDSRSSSEGKAVLCDEEQPAIVENKTRDEPPDGGYGWVCVICCFLINVCNIIFTFIAILH